MAACRLYRTARWLLLAALCIYVLPIRAESGAAKVITLNGQVSVLRDNSPWVLNIGDSVQPRQIILTGPDGFAVFRISDGSTFEVFPNARVVFRENSGSWRDLLDVLLGRVKVHIQKLGGGRPNYNRVRTPTAVISVRGTIFDVAIEDEDDTTLVSVEEGQVGVQHLLRPGPERILNEGESIRVFRNQPLAVAQVDKSVIRGFLRAAEQAMYEIVYRTRLPGTGSGAGACPVLASCDKKTPTPPPTTPPPQH